MSSVVSAIYLWLFTIGLVSSQVWLIAIAVFFLASLMWFFRGRGASAIALVSVASTSIVLANNLWPLKFKIDNDPFQAIRDLTARAISGVNQDAAALVLGLSVGDDSLVSHDLRQAMQLTSLTHLMAVSGANCAIVIGAVYFLMFKFPISGRIACSVGALLAYVAFVGFQASVLRAAAMATAVMLGLIAGRKIHPLSALSLSVIVLLCLSPSLATNYGFALSVLATAGILVLAPRLYRSFQTRMPKWVAMGLAVSVSAQLFCFPVLLSLQGGVPTYSLLANLICEPLVAPITILGLLGILFLWCPPISSLIFWLASVAAWPIAATAKFLSAFPFATLPWRLDIWGVIAAAAVVIAILVAIFGKKRSTQNLSWLVVFSIFACSIGLVLQQAVRISLWPMVDWQVASCDVGQGDATVIRDGEAIALIDVGRDEKKIDSCLSKLGVTQIDLLVLTHFDADHVNGLAGAINQRVIGEAMLTSYFDERPGADFSRTQLTTAHIPILNAEQGLEGLLGSVTWRVLSPSRTATEAEDANDGSITMLWHFYDFQLITLADLGEKGQQRLAASVNTWWNVADLPLVMKVSHHGSADQYSEFLEWLKPKVALISVGARNGYGHPTKRTLDTLNRTGSVVLRTDLLGSIALKNENGDFELSYSGSS